MSLIPSMEQWVKWFSMAAAVTQIQSLAQELLYAMGEGKREYKQEEKTFLKFWQKKKKTHQPRILCPTKLSFKSEGEIKTYSGKQKLMEFVASTYVFQEMSKEVL